MVAVAVETLKKGDKHAQSITISPINIQGMALELDFIEHLFPNTKHYQFFGTVHSVSEKILSTLCDLNTQNSMEFIAAEQTNARQTAIGVCRYVVTENPHIYKMALTIADKWQYRGLHTLLMNQLIKLSKIHGVTCIYSIGLVKNVSMYRLSKDLGMQAKIDPNDHRQIIYSLPI